MQLELPAPAKINLFLHILERRPDGYHELQSVFRFLELADTLSFEPTRGGVSVAMDGVSQEDNLVYRAARLLSDGRDVPGVNVTITKRIPLGAGLGGGSSDAATTLHGLNIMWELGLSDDELAELGLQIGADVPVFVRGFTAFAEGIGERLAPVDLPEIWYVLLVPESRISTAEIFTQPDLTRDTSAITIARFLQGESLRNDCETVVRRLYPEVGDALDWLSQRGTARMTGTGACVFLETGDEAVAREILSQSSWRGFVSKGTKQSVLFDALVQKRK
ncbi:MAG TPA: 4-(cytidine 5'-diphospho)-2-C-methyl-D-erythritol kinase [Gammaproteobacteria bacterium]|nr:4-(cytidine 5'-diphospho)-2-C-methyl-D-erythritol kinase [Gammaproteobacteria bacterium]|tara:strand:+ start:1055 stop:1885 length:831 start_codon:yes stop_codon:yes gene_type:complete